MRMQSVIVENTMLVRIAKPTVPYAYDNYSILHASTLWSIQRTARVGPSQAQRARSESHAHAQSFQS